MIKNIFLISVFILLSVVVKAQPFRLSIYSNTFPTTEKVYLDIRKEGSFVVIDSFIPKASLKDFFKSIQFREAAFLQIRNAQQTVCRKFYVDGTVSISYDSIAGSITVDGSGATTLYDSFYNSLSKPSTAIIKNNTQTHYNAVNSVYADGSLTDPITSAYKDFVLRHPNSYLSLDLIEYCNQKMPNQDLYFLLQSLNPDIKKHSFYKWQFLQLQQQISKGEPEKLPAFNILDARKKTFSHNDLQQGIFLIDFWGTWCEPCIAAMPKLEKLFKKYDGKVGFVSYAMQINSTPVAFEAAEKKYGISWNSYFENRNAPTGIADIFKIEGYPTYILIKDGLILKKSLSERGLPQIASLIERLLAQK